MPVPEPRGVCRHHTFEQAPLGSRVVRLEFGAANILVYVFLYLSLHQNNCDSKPPPQSSRWGSGEEWGAGKGPEGMCLKYQLAPALERAAVRLVA